MEPLIYANFSKVGGRGDVCGLRLIGEARAVFFKGDPIN